LDERHQHQPVENRNAAQGNEPDRGTYGKRQTSQGESPAPHRTERDARRHDQQVANRAEAEVEHDEDQTQRHRHNDLETTIGTLHVFELAASFDGVLFG
jgi:hypothetical protein